MKILVHPQVLQDENFGILLGCYTKDQIYISKKLPKEPSDLKLLSKVLVQGNFIIGIYSNEKLDEKTLSKRLDVLNNLYEEKFPKVFLQKFVFFSFTLEIYVKFTTKLLNLKILK